MRPARALAERSVPAAPPPAEPPAIREARRRAYTVGEVLNQVRQCLEEQFRPVLVCGEVRDLRRPRGGHLYLNLTDAGARLRIVVFSSVLARLDLRLEDGDEVLVWGRVSAYPRSGDVQLVADRLEPLGEGARRARKEQLRRRLDAEGLFAPARKRRPPFLPRAVGLVTSPTGAAIRDVLTTLERRFPLRVVLAPVRVNGAQAAPAIAAALADLDRRGGVDVILVVRGGGSQEDLAAFDEEDVVRAVAAAATPVITGVGHEVDVTLADLAADRRAPTPTGAAELAVPVRSELLAELERREGRLLGAVRARVATARRRVDLAARAHGLHAPAARVRRARERLDEAERRLRAADPRARLAEAERALAERAARLERAGAQAVARAGQALAGAAARLETLSPLAVLGRGYSLTTGPAGVVRSAAELAPGDRVTTRLAAGRFVAEVVEIGIETNEEQP